MSGLMASMMSSPSFTRIPLGRLFISMVNFGISSLHIGLLQMTLSLIIGSLCSAIFLECTGQRFSLFKTLSLLVVEFQLPLSHPAARRVLSPERDPSSPGSRIRGIRLVGVPTLCSRAERAALLHGDFCRSSPALMRSSLHRRSRHIRCALTAHRSHQCLAGVNAHAHPHGGRTFGLELFVQSFQSLFDLECGLNGCLGFCRWISTRAPRTQPAFHRR